VYEYLTVYHIVPMTAPKHRLSIRHIISKQEHILLLFYLPPCWWFNAKGGQAVFDKLLMFSLEIFDFCWHFTSKFSVCQVCKCGKMSFERP